MSNLPANWSLAAIGEIANVVTGKTPPTSEKSNYGNDVPFIKPPDLDGEDPLFSTKDYVSFLGARSAQVLPEGSVAVSCIGNLGKVAYLGRDAITNQQINAIEAGSPILDSRYVYHWAKTLKPWLEQNSSATTVAIINKSRFAEAPIPVPPRREQQRIVAKVEALSARVHVARDSLDAIPPLLEKFRQSVLAAAFRGDLTADWRRQNPDAEPASALLDRIRTERRQRWEEAELAKMRAKGKEPKDDKWEARYTEPLAHGNGSLPKTPSGWSWATIEELADVRLGKMLDRARRSHGEEMPYLRNLNVRWYDFDLSDLFLMPFETNELMRYSVRQNDVVVCEGGEPGRAAVWREPSQAIMYQKALHRLRPYSGVAPDWLVYSLRWAIDCGRLQQFFTGSTIKHLTREALLRVPILVAPYEEQTAIIRQIASAFLGVSQLTAVLESASTRLTCLNQSILAKAFRGELVPQDPNDEPASVLLQRIRAEREATSQNGTGKKRKAK